MAHLFIILIECWFWIIEYCSLLLLRDFFTYDHNFEVRAPLNASRHLIFVHCCDQPVLIHLLVIRPVQSTAFYVSPGSFPFDKTALAWISLFANFMGTSYNLLIVMYVYYNLLSLWLIVYLYNSGTLQNLFFCSEYTCRFCRDRALSPQQPTRIWNGHHWLASEN